LSDDLPLWTVDLMQILHLSDAYHVMLPWPSEQKSLFFRTRTKLLFSTQCTKYGIRTERRPWLTIKYVLTCLFVSVPKGAS
jgi:hypothetical protein